MKIQINNVATGETIYTLATNMSLTLDEALDLVAPSDWRDQVNTERGGEIGYFVDGDKVIWCDDLEWQVL